MLDLDTYVLSFILTFSFFLFFHPLNSRKALWKYGTHETRKRKSKNIFFCSSENIHGRFFVSFLQLTASSLLLLYPFLGLHACFALCFAQERISPTPGGLCWPFIFEKKTLKCYWKLQGRDFTTGHEWLSGDPFQAPQYFLGPSFSRKESINIPPERQDSNYQWLESYSERVLRIPPLF